MLEVLNLTKIYKSKGDVEVRALDGVSLRFPERGMVFLLGKSGSGKSTLLNVCGGLDAPTSGEIIVKGRSSRDFTQSDFDSYRNTFIGFIFQEYNILNEFSVEDNIALALELQGKPKDKEAVAALLEEVDLLGYAKRKPNTLSGGQKQRIAIARALIKSPEIIMADEPTGALDSNTGKQVFDTLKKLSRDKLVVVVSHDRDFAEQYGDRIIELKDGKILSDVTKTVEEQRAISENVTAIGKTLCIKRGTSLTDSDFDKIRTFLTTSENEVMITGGAREVKAFREATRITDDGGQEVFRETAGGVVEKGSAEGKAYTPEDCRFIRSKLPLRHAARIGFSGLRTKPFRLFFTTILCTVAFILFGLLSTLTFYDSESTFRATISSADQSLMKVSKYFKTKERSYEYGEFIGEYEYFGNSAKFSKAELDAFAAGLGTRAFPICESDVTLSAQQQGMYWQNSINCFAALTKADGMIGELLAGDYPTADNEIMISDYLADSLINTKAFLSNGDALSITERADLIGKKFSLDLTHEPSTENVYTVVGIFKAPEIPEKFAPLKEGGDNSLRYEMIEWLADGTALLAIVTQEKLDAIVDRFSYSYGFYGDVFSDHDMSLLVENRGSGDKEVPSEIWENNAYYASVEHLPKNGVYYFDASVTAPGAKQAIVCSRAFYERLRDLAWSMGNALQEAGKDNSYDANTFSDEYERDYTLKHPRDHYLSEWRSAVYNPMYVPPTGLEAVYAEFKDEFFDGTDFNFTLYDVTIRAQVMESLVDLGLSEDEAGSIYDMWWRIVVDKNDMEVAPGAGDPTYEAFESFRLACEERMAYNNDYLWYSVAEFKYTKKINEALGEYKSFWESIGEWVKSYDPDHIPTVGYGLDALYAQWHEAYKPQYLFDRQLAVYGEVATKADLLLGYGQIYEEDTDKYRDPTVAERESFRNELFAFYNTLDASEKITYKVKLFNRENQSAFGETMVYTPIGVYEADDWGVRLYIPAAEAEAYWQSQRVLIPYSFETTTRYVEAADAVYSSAFILYDNTDAAQTEALTALYMAREEYDENDASYVLSCTLASTFGMVDSMVSEFSKIFLYVGLVLAVFSALLLSNFISVSISHKRREIGILRAVGARSIDVFKIFFSESFFITALCVLLSLIGSVVICSVINGLLVDMIGASLFVFGILSVAVLVGVALVTAVLATFLPVYNAAKKRPVEAILSL